jgi:hypothetical protein
VTGDTICQSPSALETVNMVHIKINKNPFPFPFPFTFPFDDYLGEAPSF